MDDAERQSVIDVEHLRLLALLHYISGGVTLAFCLFGLIMFSFFFGMLSSIPQTQQHGPPPAIVFGFFGAFAAIGVVYGVLEIVAGRFISQRRHRVYSLIVSIPRIITIPYGLLLSVFTLVVLERPSVRRLYHEAAGP